MALTKKKKDEGELLGLPGEAEGASMAPTGTLKPAGDISSADRPITRDGPGGTMPVPPKAPRAGLRIGTEGDRYSVGKKLMGRKARGGLAQMRRSLAKMGKPPLGGGIGSSNTPPRRDGPGGENPLSPSSSDNPPTIDGPGGEKPPPTPTPPPVTVNPRKMRRRRNGRTGRQQPTQTRGRRRREERGGVASDLRPGSANYIAPAKTNEEMLAESQARLLKKWRAGQAGGASPSRGQRGAYMR